MAILTGTVRDESEAEVDEGPAPVCPECGAADCAECPSCGECLTPGHFHPDAEDVANAAAEFRADWSAD